MLAATFLRMIPASIALSTSAPVLILAGYFLVQFFEHTLAPHFHFGEESHNEVMMNPAVGISALVGLSIHTFFDGVSIASGFLSPLPGPSHLLRGGPPQDPRGRDRRLHRPRLGTGKRGALTAAFVLAGATMAGVLGMNAFTGAVGYALPSPRA